MPKLLVIYGSCQTQALYRFLTRHCPNEFRYECLSVYEYYDGRPLPEWLEQADIFVYQPVLNGKQLAMRRRLETAPLVERFRTRGIPCIATPFVHFQGYHPDHCYDPRFPYGMQGILDRMDLPLDDIVEDTRRDDFLSEDLILRKADATLTRIGQREVFCDIKVRDWIEGNFRRTPLFHTVDHPTNALLQQMFEPVFRFIGLSGLDFRHSEELLCNHKLPIYPCVQRAMRLQFDVQPIFNYENVSYERFISHYVSLHANQGLYKSTLACRAPLTRLAPGELCSFEVEVRNESQTLWQCVFGKEPYVRISYHWKQGRDTVVRDGDRTDLPHALRPDERACVHASVRAPSAPGLYRLCWDLLIEGKTWFSEQGYHFPSNAVIVEEPGAFPIDAPAFGGAPGDPLSVVVGRDYWLDHGTGLLDITAPRRPPIPAKTVVPVSDDVLARDITYFARIMAEGIPALRANLAHYVPAHLKRFIRTFHLVNCAEPGDRLLDLAAFYPFTYCLYKNTLLGEIRCSDFRPPDETRSCAQRQFRDESYDVTITLTPELYHFDYDRFVYPDSYFDVVLCLETIEHLQRDVMQMMSEINRVLRIGGRVIITTPNVVSSSVVGQVLRGEHPNGSNKYTGAGEIACRHSREYTPADIALVLEAAGFAVERLETVNVWSEPDINLLRAIEQLGFSSASRGDCIMAVGRKVQQGIRDRYPGALYA